MESRQMFVIVGAGLAGAKTAEALRIEGFEGRIVLVGAEAERPYDRPPLSKNYLQDRSEKDKIFVHPEGWYARHDVELRLGTRVTRIDAADHQVACDHGAPLHYDKLLLATGSTPRMLALPGAGPRRLFTLRSVEDCERLKTAFAAASRVVIVGAGWLGLEVAAAARAAGLEVVVLEPSEVPLLRVLGREAAGVFADLHRRNGVDLRCRTHVTRFTGGDPVRATGVLLADGTRIDADLVVLAVGAVPNTRLAQDAGLVVGNGVHVDAHLRTSHPDIVAAGDVANELHPLLGKRIRIEHWANAAAQPAVAAKSMLGIDAVYDELPYFYSDQFDLGMEYSGYVEGGDYDEVVFRKEEGGDTPAFVAFWMKDHRVLAGMNVNVWDQTENVRSLISSGRRFDSAALADAGTPLMSLLDARAA